MPRARRNRRAAAPSAAFSPPPTSSASDETEDQGSAIEVVALEQPFAHPHRFQALKEAYEPGKRRSTNAYDDVVTKRRKIDPELGVQLSRLQSNDRSRRSPSTGNSCRAVRTARVHAYVADMVTQHKNEQERISPPGPKGFAMLPAEIRAEIFRYLLVHHKPILVLGGWKYVYPRGRPNLHTGLLGVCRGFYYLGLRILYGENTFRYRTRDPLDAHRDTYVVMKKVYEEDGCMVPVQKHGHLIRNIEIDIEANRMRDAKNRDRVIEALVQFLPDRNSAIRAQLKMVTLEIYLETRKTLGMEVSPTQPGNSYPARDLFASHSDVLECLHKINCQFVRIVAHRPQDLYYLYESVVDRRPYFTARNAAKGNEDFWSVDKVMLESRRKSAEQSTARLNKMAYWLEKLIKEPDRLLRENSVFRAYVPEPEEHKHVSTANPPRKSRARAPKKTDVQTQLAAGSLTEEGLECVAGPSNWASLGQLAHASRADQNTHFTIEQEGLSDSTIEYHSDHDSEFH